MNEETVFDPKGNQGKAQHSNKVSKETLRETGMPIKEAKAVDAKQNKTKTIAGAVGIAGVAGTVGAIVGIMTPIDLFSNNPSEGNDISGGSISGHGLVGHDMNVAKSVDDSMSFEEAFAAAREEVGPGGIFVWHGHAYGTYYEAEWNAISPEDKEQYWADVHHTVQHNEYIGEHLQGHGSVETNTINSEDQNIGAGGEGQVINNPLGDDHGDQQAHINQNGGGNEVLPTDPPGGWSSSQEPVDLLNGGNSPQDPVGSEPILGPEGELILVEDEVYEEIDQDGDGVVDMAIVNADGNDIPDVLLDTTGDGEFDALALDAVENGDIISLDNTHEINGVCVIEGVEVPSGIPIDEEVPIIGENLDFDPLANTLIDPDIPIDNSMNMGEFV